MNQIILAIILSFLPITELRAGIPVAIDYALKNNLPVALPIIICIFTNIFAIFFVFFFLDFVHSAFIKMDFYSKLYKRYLESLRKKIDKFEKNYAAYGFWALIIFVAVPIPGTGAWTGAIIAWILGLDRKKSIISIILGVIIAGLIVSLASIGVLRLLI